MTVSLDLCAKLFVPQSPLKVNFSGQEAFSVPTKSPRKGQRAIMPCLHVPKLLPLLEPFYLTELRGPEYALVTHSNILMKITVAFFIQWSLGERVE